MASIRNVQRYCLVAYSVEVSSTIRLERLSWSVLRMLPCIRESVPRTSRRNHSFPIREVSESSGQSLRAKWKKINNVAVERLTEAWPTMRREVQDEDEDEDEDEE